MTYLLNLRGALCGKQLYYLLYKKISIAISVGEKFGHKITYRKLLPIKNVLASSVQDKE